MIKMIVIVLFPVSGLIILSDCHFASMVTFSYGIVNLFLSILIVPSSFFIISPSLNSISSPLSVLIIILLSLYPLFTDTLNWSVSPPRAFSTTSIVPFSSISVFIKY